MKVLDSASYGTQSFFIGMRNEMELDGGNYYIHLIHTKSNSTPRYMRVSPDATGTVYSIELAPTGSVSGNYGNQAVFVS